MEHNQQPSPTAGTEDESHRIMVVDECRMTRRRLSLYLQEAGYQVGVAENGLDALAGLPRESNAFIMTGLNMPRMDGVELTRIVRNDPAYGSIPVIILTTPGEEQERVQGMQAGALVFLTKPIRQPRLIREVRQRMSHADQRVESVT